MQGKRNQERREGGLNEGDRVTKSGERGSLLEVKKEAKEGQIKQRLYVITLGSL